MQHDAESAGHSINVHYLLAAVYNGYYGEKWNSDLREPGAKVGVNDI